MLLIKADFLLSSKQKQKIVFQKKIVTAFFEVILEVVMNVFELQKMLTPDLGRMKSCFSNHSLHSYGFRLSLSYCRNVLSDGLFKVKVQTYFSLFSNDLNSMGLRDFSKHREILLNNFSAVCSCQPIKMNKQWLIMLICRFPKNKLYDNKHMITLTQITSTEIFSFIAVLVFKLLSRKVLFITRKDNRNC